MGGCIVLVVAGGRGGGTGGGGRRRGDGELDRLAGLGLEEEHDPHLRGARARAGWESVEDAGQNARQNMTGILTLVKIPVKT